MYQINKSKEPDSLTVYRAPPDAEYDGPNFTPVKDAIKTALLAEQGHVCAYCMQRIGKDKMKVEHWACQAEHPDEQLSYQNMLACCEGLEGQQGKFQTCDTKKGNQPLKYSPAQPQHQINDRVNYSSDGTIGSNEL